VFSQISNMTAKRLRRFSQLLNDVRYKTDWRKEIGGLWIFRGQADVGSYELLPQVFRAGYATLPMDHPNSYLIKKVFDLADTAFCEQPPDTWKELMRQPKQWASKTRGSWRSHVLGGAARDALAHALLVRNFALLAQRAGHRVPLPELFWHLPNHKLPCLAKFVKGEQSNEDMVFCALAQHHKTPTVLLDWTYDPSVACFFAATSTIARASKDDMVIWALNEDYLNADLRIKRLTMVPQMSAFLDAQAGLFTWYPRAYIDRIGGRYKQFDKIIEEDIRTKVPIDDWFRKYTLPATQALPLLKCLWHEKVSWSHLMPSLDQVTCDLRMFAKFGL
jgi:hypothetical protein